MKRYIPIILIAMIFPVLLNAQFAKTGTAGLQFLKIGVDARATGMGEAYTAVSDDISSVYWNPAGLAMRPENQIFFNHTEWVADIRYEFVSASRVTDIGTFAFTAALLWMPPMEVTTEEAFGPTGEEFTASDFSAGITYASEFTDRFAFGMTAKYLRQNLDTYNVHGMSVDLGSRYNTGWRNLTIGMSLRNFGPDLEYDLSDQEPEYDPLELTVEEMQFQLPMNFSLGLVMDVINREKEKLIVSAQLDNCVDRMETYNLGFEYALGQFKIRSGYQFNLDAASYSAGFGWTIPTRTAIIDLDYSYADFGYLTESFLRTPHRFSIKLFY